jgi:gas vesicle protein
MIEGATIKPSGSLSADQWRKQSERRAKVQRQVRDENQRHSTKVRDLQDRLA